MLAIYRILRILCSPMFAPGIAHPSGRQWPLVRAFFLKKSEARSQEPRITRMALMHLKMQRDAIGGCQRNDQMPKVEPRMTRMHLRMTNDGMTNVEGMTK